MKAIPQLMKFMTTTPHSIGADQTLKTANQLMRENQIRHLPVMKNGTLVGMLSDRDLKLALGISGVNPDHTKVEEVATEDVYLVPPEAMLDEVVKTMAERRIGSAAVISNHKLVGIFTATDALRAFYDLMHSKGRM